MGRCCTITWAEKVSRHILDTQKRCTDGDQPHWFAYILKSKTVNEMSRSKNWGLLKGYLIIGEKGKN